MSKKLHVPDGTKDKRTLPTYLNMFWGKAWIRLRKLSESRPYTYGPERRDLLQHTELRERMGPRLRELPPAVRGGKNAGSRNLGPVVSRNSELLYCLLSTHWLDPPGPDFRVPLLFCSRSSRAALSRRHLRPPSPFWGSPLCLRLEDKLSKISWAKLANSFSSHHFS